jgi:hypothetical protein
MPRQRHAAPARQQRKAIAQSRRDLLDAKRCGTGRGKLDGERYAVEVTADLRNRRQAVGP